LLQDATGTLNGNEQRDKVLVARSIKTPGRVGSNFIKKKPAASEDL
jgi:hypothetical protein